MPNIENNNDDKNNENENSETPSQEQLDREELIEKNGEVVAQNAKHLIHCLNVIGQVEGHYILPPQNKTTKYEHIIPALVAIEQDRSIEGVVVVLPRSLSLWEEVILSACLLQFRQKNPSLYPARQ